MIAESTELSTNLSFFSALLHRKRALNESDFRFVEIDVSALTERNPWGVVVEAPMECSPARRTRPDDTSVYPRQQRPEKTRAFWTTSQKRIMAYVVSLHRGFSHGAADEEPCTNRRGGETDSEVEVQNHTEGGYAHSGGLNHGREDGSRNHYRRRLDRMK